MMTLQGFLDIPPTTPVIPTESMRKTCAECGHPLSRLMHIVHYPLKAGRSSIWWSPSTMMCGKRWQENRCPGRRWNKDSNTSIPPQQVIDHGTDWRLWVLCDRDPVRVGGWPGGIVGAQPTRCCSVLPRGLWPWKMRSSFPPLWGNGSHKALALYLENGAYLRVVIDSRLIGDHIYHPSGQLLRCATR